MLGQSHVGYICSIAIMVRLRLTYHKFINDSGTDQLAGLDYPRRLSFTRTTTHVRPGCSSDVTPYDVTLGVGKYLPSHASRTRPRTPAEYPGLNHNHPRCGT